MRLPAFFFALALSCGVCCGAQQRDVTYQGPLTPNNITPTFEKGYLLVYDYPRVHVYAADGSPLCSIAPEADPARIFPRIQNAGADVDGTLAAAIEYRKGDDRGGGIAVFDNSGKQLQFFDTGKYLPTQVSFADDHTIWTLGWRHGKASHEDYFILRNYSQNGEELGAFLPRSSFEHDPEPVGPMTGAWQLRVTGERIGALFYESSILQPGQQLPPMLWVELDLKGKELGRWEMGGTYAPRAFTRSGALYRTGGGLSLFDRSAKTWRRVADAPSGELLGADGNDLVFREAGTNTLRWVPFGQ